MRGPGHDAIMIDQFKGLGEGGKRMFLETQSIQNSNRTNHTIWHRSFI